MVDGGDDDDDGGVSVVAELVGAVDVELPTGSAKLSEPWLCWRETSCPRWAFCCGAVDVFISVVVAVVGATVIIRRVASWRCHARTMMKLLVGVGSGRAVRGNLARMSQMSDWEGGDVEVGAMLD